MKVRLSLILLEANSSYDALSGSYLSVLLDEDHNLPSVYLSTKTVEESLQELISKYTFLNRAWSPPVIAGCRHDKGALETEVLYTSMIPDGICCLKMGSFVNLRIVKLDEFYEAASTKIPRSIGQP